MDGEKLCRIRLSGPIPGKKANSVGEAEAPNRKRLPWRTKLPFVFRLRTANAPAGVALPIPTTGWSFHEPRKSTGRLIPVSQSSVLWKSLRNV